MVKEKNITYSILCGIFIGASYLTYASSYTIFPFLTIFIIMASIRHRRLKHLTSFFVSLSVFLLIFYPFLLATILGNNFLITRINQVSIFQPGNPNWIQILSNSLVFNLRALYTTGLGGVNEYYFGHQALFDTPTFLLIILGLLTFLWQFIRKNIIFFYPLLIIGVTFTLGMVLTVPLGAFHRIYISFPFIALVIAGTVRVIIEGISKLKILPKSSVWLFLILIVVIFSTENFYSAKNMIDKDEGISILTDSVYIQSLITTHFPKRSKIYIAAYPAYHLGKELFFRLNNSYFISTDYFPTVLSSLQPTDLLIIQYPNDDEKTSLINKFPKGKYLTSIGNYNLKYHAIFIPK
jgi:4-amino-4-deoxy-L-arabinose transferase-like glycosyltransferase